MIDPDVTGGDRGARATSDSAEAKAASLMTDDFLLRAYERTTGQLVDPEAEALLAEIDRRGLDV